MRLYLFWTCVWLATYTGSSSTTRIPYIPVLVFVTSWYVLVLLLHFPVAVNIDKCTCCRTRSASVYIVFPYLLCCVPQTDRLTRDELYERRLGFTWFRHFVQENNRSFRAPPTFVFYWGALPKPQVLYFICMIVKHLPRIGHSCGPMYY